MSKLRDAAQQALEALIAATPVKAKDPQMQADAIVALRAARAEAADDARGRELLEAFDDAPQPKADRADVPAWDEVYDCAVAAYCRSSTSKDALRLCFQSRHQQHHIAVGWTANELMDFAKGIAALYTAPQPVKREPLTVDILPALKGGVSAPEI